MPEETFKEYMARKWPQYCEMAENIAIETMVAWKLGHISAEQRDSELDKVLTPEAQKKLIAMTNEVCK